MWSKTADFMESLIREYGLVRISSGLVVVVGILAAAGVLTDRDVLADTLGAVLLVLLVFTIIALGVDRRSLYAARNVTAEVLDRFAAVLVDAQTTDSFSIEEWDEQQVVNARGDVIIERWFTLRVGNEPLQAFWHRAYTHGRDVTARDQRRVKVAARPFEPTGDARTLGVNLPVTTTWDGSSLRVFIHFSEAQAPRSTVHVKLRISWPGYAANLMKRSQVEPVEWTALRSIDRLTFSLRLPAKVLRTRILNVTSHAGSPAVQQIKDGGRRELKFEMQSLPIGTKVGFRVEITPVGDH